MKEITLQDVIFLVGQKEIENVFLRAELEAEKRKNQAVTELPSPKDAKE